MKNGKKKAEKESRGNNVSLWIFFLSVFVIVFWKSLEMVRWFPHFLCLLYFACIPRFLLKKGSYILWVLIVGVSGILLNHLGVLDDIVISLPFLIGFGCLFYVVLRGIPFERERNEKAARIKAANRAFESSISPETPYKF